MRRARYAGALVAGALGLVCIAFTCCGSDAGSPASIAPSLPEAAPSASFDPGPLAPPDAAPIDRYIPWDGPPKELCDPPRRPEIPDGWERWDGYDPCCEFYLPAKPEAMPEPLSWVPCQGDVPAGLVCKQIGPSATRPGAGTLVSGQVNAAGAATFLLGYGASDVLQYEVVADADGAVRQAILAPNWKRCGLEFVSSSDGKYALGVHENNSPFISGVLAGDIGEARPSLVMNLKEPGAHAVLAGKPGLLDVPSSRDYNLYSWSDGSLVTKIWDLKREPGWEYGSPSFFGDTLYWGFSSGGIFKVKSWTLDRGASDLLASSDVPVHSLDSLATDGVSMAWLDGTNVNPQGLSSTVRLVTSRYAIDKAALQPRVLRDDLTVWGFGEPMVVGCGYVARADALTPFSGGVLLSRLSDGQAWYLPTRTDGMSFSFSFPRAITCDELFLDASYRTDAATFPTVARIRLDSLGPGLAPSQSHLDAGAP